MKMLNDLSGYLQTAFSVAMLCASCSCVGQELSDQLPRRGALGVPLGMDVSGHVIATAVPTESAAERVGLKAGDAIMSLDGENIESTSQVQAIIGRHRGGDSISIEFERAGQRSNGVAQLKPFPFERLPNTKFTYGHVTLADGTRLRTILSIPADANSAVAAVLMLQGGGCGSIDVPFGEAIGPTALVHALAQKGYATMRVEKPGTGDSEGRPCTEIGYREELAGYQAALRALLSNPAVDPRRVFLIGISLGGFFAPFVAQGKPLAGVSAYGTLAFSPTPYPGRSELFFREIAAVDVLGAWARVNTRVQLLHGTYDDRTTASDHAKIAAIVNGRHPGYAQHRELSQLDHCWTQQATPEAAKSNCGGGKQTNDLVEAILGFMAEASSYVPKA